MHTESAVTPNKGESQAGLTNQQFADFVSTNPDLAAGHMEIINFAIGDDQYGVDIMSVREISANGRTLRICRGNRSTCAACLTCAA